MVARTSIEIFKHTQSQNSTSLGQSNGSSDQSKSLIYLSQSFRLFDIGRLVLLRFVNSPISAAKSKQQIQTTALRITDSYTGIVELTSV